MGVIGVAVGIYELTAIFVPRYRTRWRGRTEPAGPVTHLGFGLMFLCVGLLFVIRDSTPVPPVILAIGAAVGMLLAAFAFIFDA